jgi:GGDEF domain-containing protein
VLETGEDEVYEFKVPGPAGTTFHDDLLIRADSAMYQAKQTGRNRICLSSNR